MKLHQGVMTYAELRKLQDKKESAARRKVEKNVKNKKAQRRLDVEELLVLPRKMTFGNLRA